MSKIFALTSSHLYGIIYRIVPNETAASKVLKAVYSKLWEDKENIRNRGDEALTYLRILAHRYAVDYKVENHIEPPGVENSDLNSGGMPQGYDDIDLSIEDRELLKSTYLDCTVSIPIKSSDDESNANLESRFQRISALIKREIS